MWDFTINAEPTCARHLQITNCTQESKRKGTRVADMAEAAATFVIWPGRGELGNPAVLCMLNRCGPVMLNYVEVVSRIRRLPQPQLNSFR